MPRLVNDESKNEFNSCLLQIFISSIIYSISRSYHTDCVKPVNFRLFQNIYVDSLLSPVLLVSNFAAATFFGKFDIMNFVLDPAFFCTHDLNINYELIF